MIAVVACNCGNALPKVYKFLQQYIENWMDVPIYQGRTRTSRFLGKFAGYPVGEKSPYELQKFIAKSSRYIAVIGWDDDNFQWADIAHGQITDQADAELVIEQFA